MSGHLPRYICVHGHFYQPPRENPWLETVEQQDSAYPYHDWNERIAAECYAPNSAARILDDDRRIRKIVSNYARISFNFGPTLLSWMEQRDPETYRAILQADRDSRDRFDGRGAAMAQAYNHMILPLAGRRDTDCQVHWGIRDFEHRFGRRPEGMWLPETAVDLPTLESLVDHGIRFTVLAPGQARRMRARGKGGWRDVSGERIDPSRAYEIRLPSRRTLALFFYDGPVSRAIAFERLLHSGESLSHRLESAFSDRRSWPQLVHTATDGETFGHHHRHGEMALAYALDSIESREGVELIHYGAFLDRHPPAWRVEILENSSWSCAHGVERWRSDCGCSSGRDGWTQAWRTPLREALDWLRDELAPHFERRAAGHLHDPWAARKAYIDVILDRSAESRERFLADHARRELGPAERVEAWKLLELQRHAMLMYTSCGWFFEDLSGIETVQVMRYAGRVVQLAREVLDVNVEDAFLGRLAAARSNVPEKGDGRRIYRRHVEPAMVDLHKVAAHYAVSRLFDGDDAPDRAYGYAVSQEEGRAMEAGKARLGVGRLDVTSEVTEERCAVTYGVLHFGDHNLTGGVRDFRGDAAYSAMVADVEEAFSSGELPETARRLDRHFLELTYSLKSLFRDQQRRILRRLLDATLRDAEAVYGQLYDRHAPLMRFLAETGMPQPAAFRVAGELVLNQGLREALESEPVDVDRVRRLLDEVRQEDIAIDRAGLGLTLQLAVEREIAALETDPWDLDRLDAAREAASLIETGMFDVNAWRIENAFHRILVERYAEARRRVEAGDADGARTWIEQFTAIAGSLHFRIE